jgi:hypothetical protein
MSCVERQHSVHSHRLIGHLSYTDLTFHRIVREQRARGLYLWGPTHWTFLRGKLLALEPLLIVRDT